MQNQPTCEGLFKTHAYVRDIFSAGNKERYNPQISNPRRNVVGLGIGPKIKNKVKMSDVPQAMRFYVERKIHDKSMIPPEHLLPEDINGLPTDVIETGRFRKCGMPSVPSADTSNLVQPGLSCGVKFGSAGDSVTGTIGAIVTRDGRRFLLSCAHILARSNGFFMGAPILVPGPADLPLLQDEAMHAQMQMDMHDQLMKKATNALPMPPPAMPQVHTEVEFQAAALAQCVPISVNQVNTMDAALAEIVETAKVDPTIDSLGALTDPTPIEPVVDMQVAKVGRATKLTKGRIIQPDICAQVDFSNGVAPFSNQILIEGDPADAFAWEGDSGALVFTQCNGTGSRRLAVGLLFAFSIPSRDAATSYGLATPLSHVLTELNVKLVIA